MNKLFKFLVIIIALIAVTFNQTNAQVTFKLGGGLGVMRPLSDYGGTTIDYYNGFRYGLSSGLNINGKVKLGFPFLNLTGEIDYSSLSNTGNSEPGTGKVDISQKVFTVKVGPEFHFTLPALPLTPYIGFNLALNSFSGETKFQGVSKVPSATYSVQSATRFGLGVYVGTELSLTPSLALDFNLSYNLMNVVGGQWNDVNPLNKQRIDSYLSLNDKGDPLYSAGDDKNFISNTRSIQSILFTVSILFGL